jgi:hypothetical protein
MRLRQYHYTSSAIFLSPTPLQMCAGKTSDTDLTRASKAGRQTLSGTKDRP